MALGGLEDVWVSGWVGWRGGGLLAGNQKDPLLFFYFKIYKKNECTDYKKASKIIFECYIKSYGCFKFQYFEM